jgi:hypothetical protein
MMSRVVSALSSLLFAAVALGASACLDESSSEPAASAEAGQVATVKVAHGRVSWIVDDDGTVGIAEVTDLVTGPAQHLVEADHATPLEVFLALSGAGAVAPPALQVDHARRVGAAAPRALSPVVAEAVVSSFADCTAAAWAPWHSATTASYSSRSSAFYTTSGDIGFTGYINGQWSRRFDVCAGNNFYDTLTIYIDRKTSAAAAYSNILIDNITGFQRFYYTSLGGAYSDWRMRLTKPGTGFPRSYGVGGAWTPSMIAGG